MFGYSADETWEFGIGDPTLMGWATVAWYWIAAMLCGRATWYVWSAKREWNRNAGFWFLLALLMAFLGVNKQLDLQTWFTLVAKQIALQQGWYESRRAVQAAFVAAIGCLGIALFLLALWLSRDAGPGRRLAIFGALFVGVFVVIRAASFHHIDRLLGWRFAGLKMNWILELSGILCVAAGAWRASRKRTRLRG